MENDLGRPAKEALGLLTENRVARGPDPESRRH